MTRDPALARRLWNLLEPIHAVTYFSPEPLEALKAAGYKGFWMAYFAGRAAPLGAVGPEPVLATFNNFARPHVSRSLPDAWSFAPPSAALTARLEGSVAALERAFGDLDVAGAAALARRAAESAPLEGRALFAANAALPWPDGDVGTVWHAATLLREHRGDGHIAALVSAGVGGREANVLHSAAGGPPPSLYTVARWYDEAEWEAKAASLQARGLLTDGGAVSPAGAALWGDIEECTDRLALSAFAVLGDDELERLVELLRPLAQSVVATGDIPAVTPIGSVAQGAEA